MIPFETVKERLLADPETRAAYDALAAEYESAADAIRARLAGGISDRDGAVDTDGD